MLTETILSGTASPALTPSGTPADVLATAPGTLRLIKRNGTVVPYDDSKIAVAITKAFLAVEGGTAAASLGSLPGVRVIIPMAAGGVEAGTSLRSALVMGADEDKISRINGQQMGYSISPKPKRFIALENAGHLAFTDLCQLTPDHGDLVSAMKQHDISVPW